MNLDVTPVPSSIVPRRRRAVWAGTCAVGAFLVAACATLAPHFATPRLSLTGIELLGGNLFQQDFRLGLRIDNPNSGALPIERVRARLRLGGQQVATGTSMQAFVVPPHGAARFQMTVNANLAAGIAELARRLGRPNASIPYELDGVVRLDLPLFHSLPFHERGTLPLRDVCAAPCRLTAVTPPGTSTN